MVKDGSLLEELVLAEHGAHQADEDGTVFGCKH